MAWVERAATLQRWRVNGPNGPEVRDGDGGTAHGSLILIHHLQNRPRGLTCRCPPGAAQVGVGCWSRATRWLERAADALGWWRNDERHGRLPAVGSAQAGGRPRYAPPCPARGPRPGSIDYLAGRNRNRLPPPDGRRRDT